MAIEAANTYGTINMILLEDIKHKFIIVRDRVRFILARALIDRKLSGEVDLPVSTKSVLFIRMDGKVGDTVVSSFVYKALKDTFPQIKIAVLTLPNIDEIYRNNPFIDKVHHLEKRPSFSAIRRLCRSIPSYETVVFPVRWLKPRDLYLLSQLNPSYVIGREEGLKLVNILIDKGNETTHGAKIFEEVLSVFGVDNYSTDYFIRWSDSVEKEVDEFVRGVGPYIAINPYGNAKSRQIGRAKIGQMIQALSERYPQHAFIILVPPDPDLKKEVRGVIDQFADVRVEMMEHANTIEHVIALIDHADLLVSVDTGTVHIATATKTPTVAIYRDDKDNFERWHPNSGVARAVFGRPRRSDYEEVDIGEFKLEDVLKAGSELTG